MRVNHSVVALYNKSASSLSLSAIRTIRAYAHDVEQVICVLLHPGSSPLLEDFGRAQGVAGMVTKTQLAESSNLFPIRVA